MATDENPINEPFSRPTHKNRWAKIIRISFLVVILGLISAGAIGYYYYDFIFGPKLKPIAEDIVLEIPTGSDLDKVANLLITAGVLERKSDFLWVAKMRKYEGKAGRYAIPQNTRSYYELVGILRNGKQLEVKVTFNNLRLKEQLAGQISRLLELDSLTLATLMSSAEVLGKYGFSEENAMAMYIPNTYNFYWNTDAQAFIDRMHDEYEKFWAADNRKAKADSMGMTPIEVYILASIVDAETTYGPEKARVAGVYLNRLNTEGWKLEADPTVVFANGDFSVRRVTNDLLAKDSPYNTYMYPGLPPGPIRMASQSAIDAVLNAEKHDYWFFCAKPPAEGEPAQHAFAKTAAQHGANARRYRAWLNSQRIYH